MSPPTEPVSGPDDRLEGWKEIAAYLDRSVRSVQRWERELGLPVRRIKTAEGQIVSASRQEIETWRAGLEKQPASLESLEPPVQGPSQPDAPVAGGSGAWRVVGWVAVFGVLVLAAFQLVSRPSLFGKTSSPVAGMVLVGRNIEGHDAAGANLWSWSFASEVSRPLETRQRIGPLDDRIAEVDLDGNGVVEHLVPVRFSSSQQPSASTDALYAFSSSGQKLWSVAPDIAFHCQGQTFAGPWRLHAVQVSSGPGGRHVWMAYAHHTYWPSFIVDVSADGQWALRYLQTGWIMSLAEWQTPAGVRLVAGGVIHDDNRPSLVLLDPDGPPAMSPHTARRFDCDDAPTALPSHVTLLPNLDVVAAQGHPYLMVDLLKPIGADMQAETGGEALAIVAPDQAVKSLTFADGYWVRHRDLESQGKLTHPAILCPEANRPQEIRTWTPENGWRRYTVVMLNGPSPERR